MLSNPFAHAVASALVLDGSDGCIPPLDIQVELYRANDIESDDTSCIRLRTERGTTVVVAATLCAEQSREPVISVHGTLGRIDLLYKQGKVRLRRHDRPPVGSPAGFAPTDSGVAKTENPGEQVWEFSRVDLLENLIDHLARGRALLVPLEATTAFMHVVEAIRTAPEPIRIPPDLIRTVDTVTGSSRVIAGVDRAVLDAAERLALFSELGLDWTRP